MLLCGLISLALVASLIPSTNAHGALVSVTGANGVDGQGFGIIANTPRDGSRRRPFQQDTSIIRQEEIEEGEAGVCGRTLAGGSNDVPQELAAAATAGLPSADAQGQVTMTLHQVNGDGAGPYTCDVSPDGGNTFQPATVTTNVPGERSRSRARATPFPLVVQMPANLECTAGPNGDACIVRCMNSARAGPFGGCAAVTMGQNAAANNATGNANEQNAANENNNQANQQNNNVDNNANNNNVDNNANNNANNNNVDNNANNANNNGGNNNVDNNANNNGGNNNGNNNNNADPEAAAGTAVPSNANGGTRAGTGNAATGNANGGAQIDRQQAELQEAAEDEEEDEETGTADATPARGANAGAGGRNAGGALARLGALANLRNSRQKREVEDDCLEEFAKRGQTGPIKKRLTLSRIAGKRSGQWIEA